MKPKITAHVPKQLISAVRPVMGQLWIGYQLENPGRGSSRNGMTVRQVLSTGGSVRAIEWLIKNQFVSRLTGHPNSRVNKQDRLRLTESGMRLANALLDKRPPTRRTKPRWDSDLRQLWVGKELVKQFRQPSQSQCLILDSFAELGWPPSIDNPLPGSSGKKGRKRLLDILRRLNFQLNQRITFAHDGNGTRIRWELNY